MRLPEQYLELVSVLKEASRNFPFIFLCKRQPKNLKIRLRCKYRHAKNLILKALKKYSSRDPVPLKFLNFLAFVVGMSCCRPGKFVVY
jgi:hypothetical protein